MGRPIVAIVGRPNVGKSSLFNKMAGRRISIVQDTPGVTRDRIYAEAEWLNYNFTIIDTGGIEPENGNIISAQIRRQASIAIETADVIIFLVDGKTGLTDSDKAIAQILRKSKKPVILVVNKIDDVKYESNSYEFYNLGIGDPISISASKSLGLGDMLDKVVYYFKRDESALNNDDYIKVAIIGRPNVGKSSLVNDLLKEERDIVSDVPGTTRDSVNSFLENEYGKFIIIDTAGMRKKSKVNEEIERYSVLRGLTSIERSDVCILMLDASESISEQDAKILGYAHELNKAIIIIVNKWDIIEKDTRTADTYKSVLKENFSFASYAPVLFISAKTGKRVNYVLKLVKECYGNYMKRVSTGILNDVISNAVMMKEPPTVGMRRLRIYYVTQPMTKPPTFIFFVNDGELVHFSYKRYLENQIRENFDFKGTAIKFKFRKKEM